MGKTKPPVTPPMPTAEHRLLVYMMGWRKAIGRGHLTDRDQADEDFAAGWNAGREAAKAEYGRACERYGAVLNVLRIQSEGANEL